MPNLSTLFQDNIDLARSSVRMKIVTKNDEGQWIAIDEEADVKIKESDGFSKNRHSKNLKHNSFIKIRGLKKEEGSSILTVDEQSLIYPTAPFRVVEGFECDSSDLNESGGGGGGSSLNGSFSSPSRGDVKRTTLEELKLAPPNTFVQAVEVKVTS